MGGGVALEIEPIWTEALRASLSQLEYYVVNLVGPEDSSHPEAFGLNELGAVAGKVDLQRPAVVSGDTGIVWTSGLYDMVLPPTVVTSPTKPFPGFGSVLADINWSGVAAGWREHDDTTGGDIAIQAFDNAITDIPSETHARATGINENGVICGWSGGAASTRGFVYDPADGGVRHVGLPGAARSRAMAITDFGWVAGDSDGQGFLDYFGTTKPLGPVASVTDVNQSGIVVGSLASRLHGEVPAQCDARQGAPAWVPIALPSRFTRGRAEAVNRFGHVVGWSVDKSGLRCAFIYKDGKAHDLNLLIDEPGWQLETATDINDRGEICGNGTRYGKPAAWKLSSPLVPLKVPPFYVEWPPVLPDGPPPPEEIALRDSAILVRLHRAATSIADSALFERVRSGLIEAGRPERAKPAEKIASPQGEGRPEQGGRTADALAAADSNEV